MTIRDVLYGNEMDINCNVRIGLFSHEEDSCEEYNPDSIADKDYLDNYLDADIDYMTIRNTNGVLGTPYIYMEATID